MKQNKKRGPYVPHFGEGYNFVTRKLNRDLDECFNSSIMGDGEITKIYKNSRRVIQSYREFGDYANRE
jgi:hypothetical protein